MSEYRPLSEEEIRIMEQAGCAAEDWSQVQVKAGFDPQRVRNARFAQSVRIGSLQGTVAGEGAVELPAEIADAHLINCTLGDDVISAHGNKILANSTIVFQLLCNTLCDAVFI